MKLLVDVVGNYQAAWEEQIDLAEMAVTAGVRQTARALQLGWRSQITPALGKRMANTIRKRDFPEQGRSIRAAALVYSNASKLVDAFDRGVVIRSQRGLYLAIPTAAAGTRGLGNKRITPLGWERRTGMRLRFVYRPGRFSLLVADNARLTSRGLAARKGGKVRKDGILTGATTVVIFILMPRVKMPKLLDLDRVTKAAEAALPNVILANWPEALT